MTIIKPVLLVSISLVVGCPTAVAQNANDIINIFGGVIQSAISQSTLNEWKKLPSSESSCVDQILRQQGSNLQVAIQQGITPSDPRMAGSRSVCRNQVAQQPNQQVRNASQSSLYIVDGLALGGQVNFDSEAYRSYKCTASEQFAGFTWCQKRREEHIARGNFSSSYSILHSQTGVALYINRHLEPAWFSGNEANDDINSRSKKYGAPTRIIPMPRQSNVPNGMIVTWGNVVLELLDSNNVGQLAVGRDVHVGFMIDHIGNFQRSAQQGLPIYRLAGGAGYVWVASWDHRGVGALRFLAVDTSAINVQMSNVGTKAEPGPEVNQKEPLSIQEVDAMKVAIAKNWDPSGYKGIITVRVRLDPNGRLSADPQVVTKSDDLRFPAASNSALKAVLAGQPYKMLKPTSYEAWKYMDIDFDPNKVAVAEQTRVVDAESAKQAAQEEAASNIDFIRATRTKISDQLAVVRNVDNRQKLEEIAARLATANIQMSSADLKALRNDADTADQILANAEEFSRVSEIASRRITVINDALTKITSDAPVIQKIQAAIKAVKLAQSGTNLRSLQDTLKNLNDSYDNNRQALQAMQFESP